MTDTTQTPVAASPDAAGDNAGGFDIEAMMRAAILGDDADTNDAPAPGDSADPASPADGADGTEGTETDAPGPDADSDTDDTDNPDSGETTDADPADLIKDPKALLKAHEEMKAKLEKRTERLKELEAKLAEPDVPGVALTPTERTPLSNVTTEKQLKEAEAFWRNELKWCRANLDGGERPAAAGAQPDEWSAEQVQARMDLALDVLGKGLNERRQYIHDFRASAVKAQEKYPFLARDHELFNSADAFATDLLHRTPELSQRPNWPEIISKAFIGDLVMSGKYGVSTGKDGKVSVVKLGSGKAAAPAVVKKVPASVPRASAPVGRKADPGAEMDARIAQAMASGDVETANRLMLEQKLFSKPKAA